MSGLYLRIANLAASVAVLIAVVTLVLMPEPTTTFRLDARTGSAEIVASEAQPKWPAELTISPINGVSEIPADCEYRGFRPARGAMISLEATASEPLEIVVTHDDQSSAGEILCGQSTIIPASDYVVLSFARDCGEGPCQPPLVRFVGELTVGSSISEDDLRPPVLEGGVLVMETASLIGGFGRVETQYTLDKGDRLSFSGVDKEISPVEATGLLTDDGLETDPPGFRIIARVDASSARILPFGPEEDEAIAVAPTFVERLQAGAQGILLGVFAAIILHIVSVLTSIYDYRQAQKEKG